MCKDPWWLVFTSHSTFVFPLRQGLSLNLELADSAKLASQRALGSSHLCLPGSGITNTHHHTPHFFKHEFWQYNSCKINPYHTNSIYLHFTSEEMESSRQTLGPGPLSALLPSPGGSLQSQVPDSTPCTCVALFFSLVLSSVF